MEDSCVHSMQIHKVVNKQNNQDAFSQLHACTSHVNIHTFDCLSSMFVWGGESHNAPAIGQAKVHKWPWPWEKYKQRPQGFRHVLQLVQPVLELRNHSRIAPLFFDLKVYVNDVDCSANFWRLLNCLQTIKGLVVYCTILGSLIIVLVWLFR